MREVFQSSHKVSIGNKAALRQFETRLRWHCHFIQKFEMEDRMEFEPINRGYKGWYLEPREDWQEAWEKGQTGFPLVDACMRCVTETGYLNFRMRAMLVSFLTHLLLQHWQRGAVFLGRQFLDFEPGIHYPQFQMQAGLTGINTIRIYNPIKQAEEHDSEALFIREWVPELVHVPLPFIFQPETMPREWRVKSGYPEPIINLSEAHRKARETLWALQKRPEVQLESRRILGRHTLPNRKA
jgi:deoxyribodipyrimidine photo-lyase